MKNVNSEHRYVRHEDRDYMFDTQNKTKHLIQEEDRDGNIFIKLRGEKYETKIFPDGNYVQGTEFQSADGHFRVRF